MALIDYQTLLLDPIYRTLGVAAAITLGDSAETVVSGLTVIDKTDGVQLGDHDAQVDTLEPACCIRYSELTANDLRPVDLEGGSIEFNGSRWKIKAYPKRPVPSGARKGELLLILANETEIESDSSS
jgi:hypothetical protein